jgi:hypothetical protein
LEQPLGERFPDKPPDLVRTLSLRAPFRNFQDARQDDARALGVHALRLLRSGHGVLNDRREPVLTLTHFHVAGSGERIYGGFIGKCRWAGAQRERDLALSIHERQGLVGRERLRRRVVRRDKLKREHDNTRPDDHSVATYRAY